GSPCGRAPEGSASTRNTRRTARLGGASRFTRARARRVWLDRWDGSLTAALAPPLDGGVSGADTIADGAYRDRVICHPQRQRADRRLRTRRRIARAIGRS